MLLTKEEWERREGDKKKLLLTREEWLRRANNEGSSNFRGRGSRDKSKIKCYNYQNYGHIAAECRKPKKTREYRHEANMALVDDDEPALLMVKVDERAPGMKDIDEKHVVHCLLTSKEEKTSDSVVWYLDNEASNHMTGSRTKFAELDESVTGKVRFGDGSSVEIAGKGTVIMICKNGEEIPLRDVYFIPSLRNNIVSLGQLSEDGNRVVLRGEFLWVFDKEECLLMKVKRSSNRLYKIIIETDKRVCLMSKVKEVSKLWHNRLGHVNYQAMSLMTRNKMVTRMPNI